VHHGAARALRLSASLKAGKKSLDFLVEKHWFLVEE